VPRHGLVLLGADSEEAVRLRHSTHGRIETFGLAPDADWRVSDIAASDGRVTFEAWYHGEPFGRFESPLFGAHNVRNALAAIAVGHAAGVGGEELRRGLLEFRGVRRRLELRGEVQGVSVFDDFAHHPTAILETIRAVRAAYPDRRLWAIFEPRSATSCRRVFQADFARAFSEAPADEVILADVFRASLPESERLSVDELVRDVARAGRRARHIPTTAAIVDTVADEARSGDLVVIMSNGGFDGIHDKLLAALAQRRH
jgi:UDP-N-acetylmuramate: L-alanyl-gamma-D-glutamyl-meso-diaminopimelate ligase